MLKEQINKNPAVKWTITIVLSFIVIFLFISCLGYLDDREDRISDSSSSKTDYVPTVSASKLVEDFEINESSAKNKYKDVIVTGTIYELMDSVLSSVDVVLETNDLYTFVKANTLNRYIDEKVANLKVGDYVKLECRNARWDVAEVNILLSDCKVR